MIIDVMTTMMWSDNYSNLSSHSGNGNDSNGTGNGTDCSAVAGDESETPIAVTVVKTVAVIVIVGSAVFGNLLVIVSVLRYEKLRLISNSFIVSLAFADLLVACLVMPFNASQELAGSWVFGRLVCDIFNANDVLFSTASLLHLCCISVDRYIAITDPLHYEKKMTRRRVTAMLCCVWSASAVLSHLPIHLKWHTTRHHVDLEMITPCSVPQCLFQVNTAYGVVSSAISFWTPAIIMVFTYVKIYREARRQEKHIQMTTSISVIPSTSDRLINHQQQQQQQQQQLPNSNGTPSNTGSTLDLDPECNRQQRRKMRREHKAAKTLGIIMGAFLFCWLPFFTWYLTTALCGERCPPSPPIVTSVLFWIGYVNSAINPIIYALFNRDFRNAFKRILGFQKRYSGVDDTAGVFRRAMHPSSTEETTLRA